MARLAGASDENIEDVKTLAEFTMQWSKFLYEIKYDLGKFKEEVAAAREFLASKMGG